MISRLNRIGQINHIEQRPNTPLAPPPLKPTPKRWKFVLVLVVIALVVSCTIYAEVNTVQHGDAILVRTKQVEKQRESLLGASSQMIQINTWTLKFTDSPNTEVELQVDDEIFNKFHIGELLQLSYRGKTVISAIKF